MKRGVREARRAAWYDMDGETVEIAEVSDTYLSDHTPSAHPETLHSGFFSSSAGVALAVAARFGEVLPLHSGRRVREHGCHCCSSIHSGCVDESGVRCDTEIISRSIEWFGAGNIVRRVVFDVESSRCSYASDTEVCGR